MSATLRLLAVPLSALALAACTTSGGRPAASPPPGAAPVKSTPQELAYCGQLSDLYTRYVGPNPNSPALDGVMPDVTGGEAVAKCRQGDARSSIPVLERLLRNADITLPPRPR